MDTCWHWPGSHFPNGRARWKGTHAAILMWTMAHGEPVPPGHDVHHTCEQVWCVNPAHLVAVLRGEHLTTHAQAQVRKRKDVCVNGHDRTEPGMTYDKVRADGRIERVCRGCSRLNNARTRERRRQG